MTQDPKFVREYGDALRRIGVDEFIRRYRSPVLVGLGLVADVSDRPRGWGRRTLKTSPRSEITLVQSIVDRVWPIKKDPGAPRGKYIMMGQSAENDVVLPDYTVSTSHCAFLWEPRRLTVLDFDSLNGTLVDDRPLEPRKAVPLSDGAVLTIGRVNLRYHTADAFLDLVREVSR